MPCVHFNKILMLCFLRKSSGYTIKEGGPFFRQWQLEGGGCVRTHRARLRYWPDTSIVHVYASESHSWYSVLPIASGYIQLDLVIIIVIISFHTVPNQIISALRALR